VTGPTRWSTETSAKRHIAAASRGTVASAVRIVGIIPPDTSWHKLRYPNHPAGCRAIRNRVRLSCPKKGDGVRLNRPQGLMTPGRHPALGSFFVDRSGAQNLERSCASHCWSYLERPERWLATDCKESCSIAPAPHFLRARSQSIFLDAFSLEASRNSACIG